MSLYMETTQIKSEQTVGEIQRLLGFWGASQILLSYEGREVSAVCFTIKIHEKDIPFALPCRWKAIHALLMRRVKRPKAGTDYEAQAKRVAWRQILRWIQAQLALVETEMVRMEEVFMPYLQLRKGKTLYETMQATNFLALPSGREE